MDINTFYELRTRLYMTAAAGCSAIDEDFRLKRALEAFEPLSQANKAFGQLYARCSKLFSGENTAGGLADCIALADALAVTQGTFSDSASETMPFSEIHTSSINAPYSRVKRVQEVIRKGTGFNEEDAEFLSDPRVAAEFVSCTGRIKPGCNTAIYETLSEAMFRKCGRGLITLLKEAVDLSDDKTSGIQIRHICKCVGAEENEWYLSLAADESAPQNVRIKAIEALACSQENTEKLIDLFCTEKGKIKNAALMSLAKLSPPEAEQIFEKMAEKYKDSFFDYFVASGGRTCTKFSVSKFNEACENKDLWNKSNNFTELLMLSNKTGAVECFARLAKDFADYPDAPAVKFAKSVLINNLSQNSDPKFRKMIEDLYNDDPKMFRDVRFYLELIQNPEKAAEAEFIHLDTLFNISYSSILSEYRLGPFSLFKSMPDNILNAMTNAELLFPKEEKKKGSLAKLLDTSSDENAGKEKYQAYAAKICGLLLVRVVYDCSAKDRDRISKAAVKFAEFTAHNYPNISALNILTKCQAAVDYRGIISSCIIGTVQAEPYARCPFDCAKIDEFIPEDEDRQKEAQDLLAGLTKELEKAKGRAINERNLNMQISNVNNYLKQFEERKI